MSDLGFLRPEFENNIVIFEISTLEFVKYVFLTNIFAQGPLFLKIWGPVFLNDRFRFITYAVFFTAFQNIRLDLFS